MSSATICTQSISRLRKVKKNHETINGGKIYMSSSIPGVANGIEQSIAVGMSSTADSIGHQMANKSVKTSTASMEAQFTRIDTKGRALDITSG